AIGIVVTSYLVRNHYFAGTGYEELIVKDNTLPIKDKRILVIGSDNSVYTNNQLATGFSEWMIYKNFFEAPAYYESILALKKQFALERPEIIIDPDNRLAAFFTQLPELKNQYDKKGNTYYIKSKNGAH
ncbi:MAG: hypothetical protein EBU52_15945, partial [Cytophagia bacterium]|nr:hypothetical protein [Cytophagia bacterium]